MQMRPIITRLPLYVGIAFIISGIFSLLDLIVFQKVEWQGFFIGWAAVFIALTIYACKRYFSPPDVP